MSNSYFQFKQFRVEQGRCAMKVTTDACIHGAWTPVHTGVKRILDIGAGTGLLSLMLAQRTDNAGIDAIEYDKAAAQQARENIALSPWPERINMITADVCVYQFTGKYDLIITNPPFFNNSLLGARDDKNKARHTVSLSYRDLLRVIYDNISTAGYASVLLPYAEYLQWKELLPASGIFENSRLLVRHTAATAVNRVVCICSRNERAVAEDELVIKDTTGNYTAAFTALLSPFYLNL